MRLKILYTAMSHARPMRMQFATHWPFVLVQCMVGNVNYVAKLFYNHDARDL